MLDLALLLQCLSLDSKSETPQILTLSSNIKNLNNRIDNSFPLA